MTDESGKSTIEQTIMSTATAIAKVLTTPSHASQFPYVQQAICPQASLCQIQTCSEHMVGLSLGRAVEIRGKCLFLQLATLKKL